MCIRDSDAYVPSGSYLNWSVLNSAKEVVPGMHGSNDLVVPLNLLDHTTVDQFHLHLEFKGGAGGMPIVYSIAGDGAHRESFAYEPSQRGWDLNNSFFTGTSVNGLANGSLTSPWLLANGPLYDAKLDGDVTNGQVQVRYQPHEPWVNVTLPHTPSTNQSTVGMQARVLPLTPPDGNMSNFTSWSVESLHMDMYGGQHPARPSLDFNLDERYELSLIHI